MHPYEKRYPWMPAKVSARVATKLIPFTPYASGWAIYYRGATRSVCGIKTPLEDVPAAWEAKRKKIDAELDAPVPVKPTPDTITVRAAASQFYTFLDERVRTGIPKPLRPLTAEDYKRTINRFGRSHGADGGAIADRPVASLTPDDFAAFALTYAAESPFTFSRVVAYVRSFFAFCVRQRVIPGPPDFGSYFVRPPQQARRDKRLAQRKAYRPAENRVGREQEAASAAGG
jgi:hypothetical protein